MCFYCGCREVPLIREFIGEHEAITDLAAEAALALRLADVEESGRLLESLAVLLEAHWRGEEDGLFHAMHAEEEYAGYIDGLVAEHRGLRDLLARANVRRTGDRGRLLAAIDALRRHVAKEEEGLFPASLTALSGEQWDLAFAAWRKAHPDTPLPRALAATP
ncbi:MAG TPA: hemerythrin domain-containing protein [Actinospica sp.]|jgi:hemerythrin-like domain-containing protein|nr:hemerythrin domain-containing protein [Actinospica sp.]